MATTTTVNGWSIPQLTDVPNIETAVAWATSVDTRANPIFASVTARNTAIPSPSEGQEAYVTATDEKYIFNGTVWVGVMPRYYVKAADESVTSSTTLQDDNHLVFAAEASSVYVAKYNLFVANGDAASDGKFGFTLPAAGTFLAKFMAAGAASTDATAATSMQVSYITSGSAVIGMLSNNQGVTIEAAFTIGVTPGNVTLQWAQNASSGTAMTLKQGSFLEVRKVG